MIDVLRQGLCIVIIAASAVCIATSSAPALNVLEIDFGFDRYRIPFGVS
jgi:hypothetical protein